MLLRERENLKSIVEELHNRRITNKEEEEKFVKECYDKMLVSDVEEKEIDILVEAAIRMNGIYGFSMDDNENLNDIFESCSEKYEPDKKFIHCLVGRERETLEKIIDELLEIGNIDVNHIDNSIYKYYRIIDVNAYLEARLDNDDTKMLKDIVNELCNTKKNDINDVVDKKYNDIERIVEACFRGRRTDLCKADFNSLRFRIHEARRELITECRNESNFSALLYEAEYMIERIYGIDAISRHIKKHGDETDPNRVIKAMKLQSSNMRNVFLNMDVDDISFNEYIVYESEFFYPLMMYTTYYTIKKYIVSKKLDTSKVIDEIFGVLRERYNISVENVCISENEKERAKKDKDALGLKLDDREKIVLDRIYKGIWNFYEDEGYVTGFEKSVTKKQDREIVKAIIQDCFTGQ